MLVLCLQYPRKHISQKLIKINFCVEISDPYNLKLCVISSPEATMKFFLLMTLFSCAATFALADGDENESGLISDASSNDNEVAGQFEEENDEEMEDDDETYRWLAPDVYDALAERERRSVNARQIPEEKELEKKKNKKKGEGKGDKNKNKKKDKKNKKKKLKKYTKEGKLT